MKTGLKPCVLDKRDLSYHRTFRFGSVALPQLPDDYNVDIGKTMPDQNDDGLPEGCTGYTQSDNIADELAVPCKAKYTYYKTCDLQNPENPDYTQPCDIRLSLKSTRLYGVQQENETTDQEAGQHRGGTYFNVYDDSHKDWFDSTRIAIRNETKAASMGSPWFPSWEGIGADGILPMPSQEELRNAYNGNWHNFACKGWTTINGYTYLMIKSWQGRDYGDHGWCYMSREVANVVFNIRGACIFMQTHAAQKDIQKIKLDLLEQILLIISQMLGIMRLN